MSPRPPAFSVKSFFRRTSHSWRGENFNIATRRLVEKRSKFLLWASAALGDGILVPMGFEYGLDGRLAIGRHRKELVRACSRASFRPQRGHRCRERVRREPERAVQGFDRGPLWPAGAGKILAAVRRSGDKTGIRVVLANPAMDRDISLPASSVSREVGEFLPLKDALRPGLISRRTTR